MKKLRFMLILFTLAIVFSFFGLPKGTFAATPVYTKHIEINKATNWLYLYENGKVVKKYRVATGKTNALTPEGTFPIVVKIAGPSWRDVPAGPNNPLGPRWNGLSVNGDNGRSYGIHGTNNPSSIGTHASHGCVRMLNSQVKEVFNWVYEGLPVWIHSDPKDQGNTKDRKWHGDSRVGLKHASGSITVKSEMNARTGPSTGSFKITSVSVGEELPRTGVSGNWTQVKLPNGKLGFIYNGDSNKLNLELTFHPASGYAVITVNNANIRSSPNLQSSVIEQAKVNKRYELLADNGEWYRIKSSSGQIGYVSHLTAKQRTDIVTTRVPNVDSAPSPSQENMFTQLGTAILDCFSLIYHFFLDLYKSLVH